MDIIDTYRHINKSGEFERKDNFPGILKRTVTRLSTKCKIEQYPEVKKIRKVLNTEHRYEIRIFKGGCSGCNYSLNIGRYILRDVVMI